MGSGVNVGRGAAFQIHSGLQSWEKNAWDWTKEALKKCFTGGMAYYHEFEEQRRRKQERRRITKSKVVKALDKPENKKKAQKKVPSMGMEDTTSMQADKIMEEMAYTNADGTKREVANF